jgi:hypothetical protein
LSTAVHTPVAPRPAPRPRARKRNKRHWLFWLIVILVILPGIWAGASGLFRATVDGESKDYTKNDVFKTMGIAHGVEKRITIDSTTVIEKPSINPWSQDKMLALKVIIAKPGGGRSMVLVPVDDNVRFNKKRGIAHPTIKVMWEDSGEAITAKQRCTYTRSFWFFGTKAGCSKLTLKNTRLYRQVAQEGLSTQLQENASSIVISLTPKEYNKHLVDY